MEDRALVQKPTYAIGPKIVYSYVIDVANSES